MLLLSKRITTQFRQTFNFSQSQAAASKVSAQQVKELRNITGASLLDCKNLLTKHNGDIAKAKEELRSKNMQFADKKTGASSTQGVFSINIQEDAGEAILVQVNCETDFVSKNQEFQKFSRSVSNLIFKQIKGTEFTTAAANTDNNSYI
jgi:elongation factor Ts